MSEFYQISSEDTAFDTMDKSVLVINLRTALYFHLTDSAARIWSLIAELKGVSEIKAVLYSEYEVSEDVLTVEVQRFIAELLDESLIKPVESLQLSDPRQLLTPGKLKFVSPVIEKFSDLQEFLLLDPIHEISSLGLPQGKSLE